jgi:hypothetical protein
MHVAVTDDVKGWHAGSIQAPNMTAQLASPEAESTNFALVTEARSPVEPWRRSLVEKRLDWLTIDRKLRPRGQRDTSE